MSTIAARDLKPGDRIVFRPARRRSRVETVSAVTFYPDVAFGALDQPLPQVEVAVVGGWATVGWEPDLQVEVAP